MLTHVAKNALHLPSSSWLNHFALAVLLRLTHITGITVGQGAVTYQLRNEDLRWATVFREIEEHRDSLGIEDYSVSQTTLEQVSLLGAT